jgi:hypothetical protein
MRHITRAGLAVATVLGALVLANGALAAINPRLDIASAPQSKSMTLGARVGQTDDWVGRLQVFVPSGYKLSPPAATGTAVTIQAVQMQIGPSNIVKMAGTMKPAATNDAAIVSWATTNCDNTSHAATWMVSVLGGDDSWTFPVFVDNTAGNETQFGSQKLVFCFGPREAGAQNPFSNKLLSLSMTLNGVTAPTAAGDYTWRSLWTPFAGQLPATQAGGAVQGGDALDQNASVEAQSVVHASTGVLTITSKKSGGKVVLGGKLVVNGESMDGISIRVKHGATPSRLVTLAVVKSGSTGAWTASTKLKKPQYFQAGATIAGGDLGSAGCKASFGVPCVSATSGGTSFVTKLIHVR